MEIKNNIATRGVIKQIVIFLLAAVVGFLIIWHLPRIMLFVMTTLGHKW